MDHLTPSSRMLVDFTRAFKEDGRLVDRVMVLFYVDGISYDDVSKWCIIVDCKGDRKNDWMIVDYISEGPLMNFITQAVVDMKYGPWRFDNSIYQKKYTYDIEEEIHSSYVVLRPPPPKKGEETKSANKN